MKYVIKDGNEYYRDGRIYRGGEEIEVPDGYPISRTFVIPTASVDVPGEKSLEAGEVRGLPDVTVADAPRRRGRPPILRGE